MDRHTCEYPSRNDTKGLESTSRVFGSDFKRLVDKVFGVQTRSYTSLSVYVYVCVCVYRSIENGEDCGCYHRKGKQTYPELNVGVGENTI